MYYLTWGIAPRPARCGVAAGRKQGRARAQGDSRQRGGATSSGISLGRYKTLAFGISAFYAGVAGSLHAIANAYVNPDVFPIILSVYLVAGLAVGGLDSSWG